MSYFYPEIIATLPINFVHNPKRYYDSTVYCVASEAFFCLLYLTSCLASYIFNIFQCFNLTDKFCAINGSIQRIAEIEILYNRELFNSKISKLVVFCTFILKYYSESMHEIRCNKLLESEILVVKLQDRAQSMKSDMKTRYRC